MEGKILSKGALLRLQLYLPTIYNSIYQLFTTPFTNYLQLHLQQYLISIYNFIHNYLQLHLQLYLPSIYNSLCASFFDFWRSKYYVWRRTDFTIVLSMLENPSVKLSSMLRSAYMQFFSKIWWVSECAAGLQQIRDTSYFHENLVIGAF